MEVRIAATQDALIDQSSAAGGPGGGPKTEEGKEVARWNATRHGIRSPAPVVPGVEKKEDWEEHRNGIVGNLSPVGCLETALAERVALLSWRLHRVTRYETEAIALSQERVEEDVADRRRFAHSFGGVRGPASPEDVRFQAEHERASHNALKRFPSLPPGKKVRGEDATSIVFGAYLVARDNLEEETDFEDLELPGVPEEESNYGLPAMEARGVWACLGEIAARAGRDPEGLLEAATERARFERVKAEHDKAEVEAEVSRRSRERILPDDKALEKIARYEAHLSRQLYQALHELENLQKHRTTGEGTPLARLDINGATVAER
jgi:hypothetical protein